MAQNYEYHNIPQDEELNFMNPTGVVDVYGRGGSLRHSGRFSAGNPYVEQMNLAVKNQDKDALFEKAVQWEADRANLLEQRAYDDPVAQIARQRAAGINPDIPSGSVGSGSGTSSGSSAVQPSTTGEIKMSNAYDNTSFALQAVDTAVSFVSGISSAATAGMNLAKDISTFGDMLSQSSSATKIAEKNVQLANHAVNTAAIGTQIAQNTADIGKAELWQKNFQNRMSQYAFAKDISSMFGKDATDDDISKTLTQLGFDDLDTMLPLISQVRKSPELLTFLEQADLNQRKAQAQNDAASFDTLRQTYAAAYEADMFDATARKLLSGFNLAVQRAVSTDENVRETVATVNASIESASNAASLSAQQTEFDLSQFGVQMQQLNDYLDDAYEKVAQLELMFAADPKNPVIKGQLDAARSALSRMEGSTCATLNEMYNIVLGWSGEDFIFSTIAKDGNIERGAGTFSGRYIDLHNYLFSTAYDATNSRVDLGPATSAFIGAAAAYITKRGGKVSKNMNYGPHWNSVETIQ